MNHLPEADLHDRLWPVIQNAPKKEQEYALSYESGPPTGDRHPELSLEQPKAGDRCLTARKTRSRCSAATIHWGCRDGDILPVRYTPRGKKKNRMTLRTKLIQISLTWNFVYTVVQSTTKYECTMYCVSRSNSKLNLYSTLLAS